MANVWDIDERIVNLIENHFDIETGETETRIVNKNN